MAVVRTPADHLITPDASGPPSTALGPADIQSAYKLPPGGQGQTVAIVDAYGDSHAAADLAAFRAYYGLPACTDRERVLPAGQPDRRHHPAAQQRRLGPGDLAGPGRGLRGLPGLPHPARRGQ